MKSAIIYDQECPVCSLYTGAFVRSGMLNTSERTNFSELKDEDLIRQIDWNRAKNEIPYADGEQNKIFYGVDALLIVLGKRNGFFKWFSKQNLLVFLSKKLYKFISLNRRVIIPATQTNSCRLDSRPDFNLKYRSIYLIFTWLITSIILTSYSSLLVNVLGKENFGREFLICGGQIIFQSAILFLAKKKKEEIFEYLGNMMSISIAGAILLLPSILLSKITSNIPLGFYIAYFLLVAGLMFLEHLRRMKLSGLPKYLSITWVVYRILVLGILLFTF